MFSICQSIGFWLVDIKNSFVLENGLLPKKPLEAESGLGWTDLIIKCFGFVIKLSFDIALLPHNMNTIGVSFSFKVFITWVVNDSQPLFLWEFASPARTVSTVFNNRTPWSAHFFK